MNEQDEHLNELFEQPVSLEEAARRLGLSRDAVRMRISRGRLRGSRASGAWLVYLTGEQPERTVRTVFDEDKNARIAELERERDQLVADKTWLLAQVEGRGVELAEMRRLLGNPQQQIEGTVCATDRTGQVVNQVVTE